MASFARWFVTPQQGAFQFWASVLAGCGVAALCIMYAVVRVAS